MPLQQTALAQPSPNGEVASAVEHFLTTADDAINAQPLSVVTAYENVHAAELFLVDLLDHDQICTLQPSVVTRARPPLTSTTRAGNTPSAWTRTGERAAR